MSDLPTLKESLKELDVDGEQLVCKVISIELKIKIIFRIENSVYDSIPTTLKICSNSGNAAFKWPLKSRKKT